MKLLFTSTKGSPHEAAVPMVSPRADGAVVD
jgi:hypothetical protein